MTTRIAITGSTGLVGSRLMEYFITGGVTPTRIVRNEIGLNLREPLIRWDIASGFIEREALEGYDAVIHLAGANIANQRWTPRYKELIRESRVRSTRLLCDTFLHLKKPPRVLLSASAVGYYGHHLPGVDLNENTPKGDDFLAQVCHKWEEATAAASHAGVRVVTMRFGVILDSKGGALAKMLPIFKLGLGGKLGSGQQVMSWVALEEIPLVVSYLLNNEKILGAVNVVSPHPVSNVEFTKILSHALNRPAFFPVPGPALKLLLGEMAETLLLNGARVIPRRLQESGYSFQFPDLEAVLRRMLKTV